MTGPRIEQLEIVAKALHDFMTATNFEPGTNWGDLAVVAVEAWEAVQRAADSVAPPTAEALEDAGDSLEGRLAHAVDRLHDYDLG